MPRGRRKGGQVRRREKEEAIGGDRFRFPEISEVASASLEPQRSEAGEAEPDAAVGPGRAAVTGVKEERGNERGASGDGSRLGAVFLFNQRRTHFFFILNLVFFICFFFRLPPSPDNSTRCNVVYRVIALDSHWDTRADAHRAGLGASSRR